MVIHTTGVVNFDLLLLIPVLYAKYNIRGAVVKFLCYAQIKFLLH